MEGDQKKKAMEERMRPLRQKYIVQLCDRHNDLKRYAEKESWTGDEHAQLVILVHSLAGSGKTYGFDDISTTAKSLEEALKENRPDARAGIPLLINAIEQAQTLYTAAEE